MIIDGRALAADILAHTKARAEKLSRRPLVVAFVAPHESAATQSYLKIKERSAAEAGCDFKVTRDTADFEGADAVIAQLPLPPELQDVLGLISVEKDADVLTSTARDLFASGDEDVLLPPVVDAVKKIFELGHIEPSGKNAVVIGAGFLVGAPVAVWLRQLGATVTVLIIDSTPTELTAALSTADIIVSGAGSLGLVKPDMIKEGVVLIDAGTSEFSGKIVGDADPACAEKCSLFTPVPGGVGPVAVACLFENVVTLVERQ